LQDQTIKARLEDPAVDGLWPTSISTTRMGVSSLKKQLHRLAPVAVFVAYFIGGKLGLKLAFVAPSATAVWPCSGIALAALLIFGKEIWPAILLGAFLVNLTTAGSVATSILIAAGNTLEALLGYYLVRKFARAADGLAQPLDMFKFAVLAGLLSTTIAATIGVTSLALNGFVPWTEYRTVWLTWWLGDAAGDLIIAPVLLLWITSPVERWRWPRVLEASAILASLLLVGQIVFNGFLISGMENYPLEYLCVPILLWAVFRFRQREAATATLVLAASAIWGTLHGFGPFARESQNESLLLLQSFLSVCAVMTLVLAANVAERRRTEMSAISLSVTDSLTGLGNYRKLIDMLESEIKRSERTKRVFALLLLDLDELKKINDLHGHQTGNQALRRVANIIRMQCRNTDIPARYGGDEFAVVMPETDLAAAGQLADRIIGALASEEEAPRLSVSVGAAVWTENGATAEELLQFADRALYEMKRSGGRGWRSRFTA
jgi:diguanylate cyclase (GGDEF)-like protein